jgi:hypothetical protein
MDSLESSSDWTHKFVKLLRSNDILIWLIRQDYMPTHFKTSLQKPVIIPWDDKFNG